MPYSRIVWIKLKIEILSDFRFTDTLTDLEKLIFVSLLLLAGDTDNNIPNSEAYIRRRLNLTAPLEEIRAAINHIIQVFPKTIIDNGAISFSNFKEYHNFMVSKSKDSYLLPGSNKEEWPEKEKEKRREEKEKSVFFQGTREPDPYLLKKKRAQRKKDCDTPEMREARDYFYEVYRDHKDEAYASLKPEPEREAIFNLLRKHSIPDLKLLINQFFASKDKFISTSKYTILTFKAVIPKLIEENTKKEKPLDASDRISRERMAAVEKLKHKKETT